MPLTACCATVCVRLQVSPILLQFLTLSMSFSMIFAGTIMPALGEKLGRAELCILNETIVCNSSRSQQAAPQHAPSHS